MTAVPLTDAGFLQRTPGRPPRETARERDRTEMMAAAQLQPLDPDIVNESIPAFFIGRNSDGFWVARDVKGRIGGIFLFESSARTFARRHSRLRGCATILLSERFELNLKNNGNVFAAHFASLARFARRRWKWIIIAIEKLSAAAKRR
jgi:hypothetical protein